MCLLHDYAEVRCVYCIIMRRLGVSIYAEVRCVYCIIMRICMRRLGVSIA